MLDYNEDQPVQPPTPETPQEAPPRPAAAPQPAPAAQEPDHVIAARIARERAELSSAQGQAAEARRWANLANAFEVAGNMVAGRQNDPASQKARLEQADRPVADVLTRRAGDRETLKDMGAELGVRQQLVGANWEEQKRDLNSAASKRVQAMWAPVLGERAKLLTAADFEEAAKLGGLDLQRLNALATQRMHEAQLGHQNAELEETRSYHRGELADKQKARELEEKKIGIEGQRLSQKPIPETETAKLVNMGQSLPLIDQLEEQYRKAGFGAPNENTRYEMMKNALSGGIAAGALPAARETPALMEEFKKGFPGTYTRDVNGASYFKSLRETVQRNMQAQIAALRGAGYSPTQIAELQRQTGGGGPGTLEAAAHPLDSAAVAWAKANPTDPRSAAILKANGL